MKTHYGNTLRILQIINFPSYALTSLLFFLDALALFLKIKVRRHWNKLKYFIFISYEISQILECEVEKTMVFWPYSENVELFRIPATRKNRNQFIQ